jgi:hypothetical protein
MRQPDSRFKRPIGFLGLVTLLGVMAVVDGLLKRRYFFLVPGLLFVVGGVAWGYHAWRTRNTIPPEP